MKATKSHRKKVRAAILLKKARQAPVVVIEDSLPPPPVHSSAWWRDRFIYLLASLPILVLAWNTSLIYTPAGYLDPWIYYAYMKHLGPMKLLFPATYYGSRLSWILPGAAIRSILPSIPANYVLHLTVFFVAVFSAYWLLRKIFDARVAVLSVICMASDPYFWGAVGWDYPDGAGIAYYLLTMALLVDAATRRRSVSLLAAGASYAGLVYSNLAWGVFSPAFLGLFIWLVVHDGKRKLWRAILGFFLWFGAGFALVTVALGSANQVLEGKFWFYEPSLIFGRAMTRTKNPWKVPTFQYLNAYWLILPALGCLAAVLFCVRARRKWETEYARLFFALNILFSAGILVSMDAAGNSLLQVRYYASYLIPGTALALGPILFAKVPEFRQSTFRFVLASAIGSLLCIWALSSLRPIDAFAGAHLRVFLVAGLAILAGSLMFSRRSAAVFFGLIGFALIGLGSRVTTELDRVGGADAYRRIVSGMEAVEHAREGAPVRFWFDRMDAYGDEFNSLNSCYLWGPTAIGYQFPSISKDAALEEGIVIVVPSSKPDVAGEVAGAFSDRHSVASPVGKTRLEAGGQGYWLHFFRVDTDPKDLMPTQISFDQNGSSVLEVAPEGAGTRLPSSRWQVAANSAAVSVKPDVPDGALIQTPKGRQDWSSIYPKLIVPRRGMYRFVLKYQLLDGDLTFGALKADKSIWLQQAGKPYRVGPDLVKQFTMAVDEGQAIWLLTANNRAADAPSRYVIEDLRVYRYKDASSTQ